MNTNNSNKQIFSLPEEELTDCEVLVMRVIWNSAEIMSIQEITSKINHTFHKDWKTQTVSTFLSRAVKKRLFGNETQWKKFLTTIRLYPNKNMENAKLINVSKFGATAN